MSEFEKMRRMWGKGSSDFQAWMLRYKPTDKLFGLKSIQVLWIVMEDVSGQIAYLVLQSL